MSLISRFSRPLSKGLQKPKPLSALAKRGLSVLAPREEDPTPLSVKYWTGRSAVPLDSFKIDFAPNKCGGSYDLKRILSARNENGELVPDMALHQAVELRAHMNFIFEKYGAVHLVNTGFTNTNEFNAATKVLMSSHMDYKGGANNRIPIEANVFDTGAPKEADLHYHHEMAYVGQSCKWVSFGAIEATTNPLKGATYISENNGATAMLMNTSFGQKLQEKGLCYVRKLPDQHHFQKNELDTSIVYNYWQTSCETDDPLEAQKIMEAKGLEVEWETSPIFGRYMVTKYYVSTMEYDPYTDKNVLFASVADDYAWFDSWPGLRDLPHQERPLKLTFGDGEVMTRDEKQLWVDCFDQNGVPIMWGKGDLAIICNYRTAHGRPKYELAKGEKRELGVILGEAFDRVGQLEGKS